MTHNDSNKIKVLYVEDDPDIRRAISQMLTYLGYEVSGADNGQRGLEKALSWQPDIILMDVRMPVMDGIEATRQIRNHPEIAQPPIIIISAYTDAKTRHACHQAGANGFLSKPVSIELVHNTLQRTIEEKNAK